METNMKPDFLAATKTYADAKNRRDLDAVIACFAPDGYYQTMGLGKPVRGAEALRRFFGGLFEAIPDYQGSFAPQAVNGPTVAAWGRFGGTLSGQFMGQPVTPGRKINVPVTFICTFDDQGRLLSDVGYFDVATMMQQAGLPAPLSPEKQDFLERFKSFWAAPTGKRVREVIAPDATVHFSGAGTVSGTDYVGVMGATLKSVPDIKVEVADYAESGELLFIFWNASGTIGGQEKRWHGVDRFHIRNGMAIEEQVIFDTKALTGG
jgi:steroid delta-isomerase-like uncharacterized protein